MAVIFRHICNPSSLIKILKEERFRPVYPSPMAGDSGINGYIEGLPFNRNQKISGRGAELIIEWYEDFVEIGNKDIDHPLPKNKLLRQGAWRAVIPCQTEREFIKVVDFEIDDEVKKQLGFIDRLKLWSLKRKLSKTPIYLLLKS